VLSRRDRVSAISPGPARWTIRRLPCRRLCSLRSFAFGSRCSSITACLGYEPASLQTDLGHRSLPRLYVRAVLRSGHPAHYSVEHQSSVPIHSRLIFAWRGWMDRSTTIDVGTPWPTTTCTMSSGVPWGARGRQFKSARSDHIRCRRRAGRDGCCVRPCFLAANRTATGSTESAEADPVRMSRAASKNGPASIQPAEQR